VELGFGFRGSETEHARHTIAREQNPGCDRACCAKDDDDYQRHDDPATPATPECVFEACSSSPACGRGAAISVSSGKSVGSSGPIELGWSVLRRGRRRAAKSIRISRRGWTNWPGLGRRRFRDRQWRRALEGGCEQLEFDRQLAGVEAGEGVRHRRFNEDRVETAECSRRREALADSCLKRCENGIRCERNLARECLVEHESERVDIGAPVEGMPEACSGEA